MAFPNKSIKKQTFLTEWKHGVIAPWWKKSFLQKKENEENKKKTIKVRIEIFQDNKRERNLKSINCQKLLYEN